MSDKNLADSLTTTDSTAPPRKPQTKYNTSKSLEFSFNSVCLLTGPDAVEAN